MQITALCLPSILPGIHLIADPARRDDPPGRTGYYTMRGLMRQRRDAQQRGIFKASCPAVIKK
jgi:hypothetical protein